MGQSTSSPIQYGVFVGEEKPGETRALRHVEIGDKPLREVNSFGVETIWDCFEKVAKSSRATANCLGTREKISKNEFGKRYIWKTYQEVYNDALLFARGVDDLGLCPQVTTDHDGDFKFIGIYSRNRVEWVVADLGSHANSVTVVTIYDTLGDQAIEFILQQTQLTTIVIEEKGVAKILGLAKQHKVGKLQHLILLDEIEQSVIDELVSVGINTHTYQEILDKGKQNKDAKLEKAKPETICTICYTSGTTGLPKGAMISHHALLSEVEILTACNFKLEYSDVYLSFLPLAHSMERLIITVVLSHGFAAGFYSGSPARLIEDAQILKPTAICGVPRIFQRIYDAIYDKINKSDFLSKTLALQGISAKLDDYHKTGNVHNVFWDNLVFGKIRDILGGKVRFMLTGSAPMAPEVVAFIKIAFSTILIEGYGQTENCAGMLLSKANDNTCGHVGGPGFANEVKLVDVPELEYTSKDKNPETGDPEPRGEICIRGPVLFKGYLNDKENTAKTIDKDGWQHTGDIGVILTKRGNAIRIIDRVKNIFKLSQGEYLAPEKLENVLVKHHYIEQIWIYGDSLQNYLVAVVVPRVHTVIDFLKTKGIEATKENVTQYYDDVDLKNDIVKQLEVFGKENGFKGFEIVKKVYISKEPFTVENDLVTPTLKIKRHVAKKKFQNEINEMYGIK